MSWLDVLALTKLWLQVNPNAIFVHKRQEGNPVLKHIRNVRWQFADIVPDYQMGQTTCAVFLSLRCVTVVNALPMNSVHIVERSASCCWLCSKTWRSGNAHK